MAFANPLGGARLVQPMPFTQIIVDRGLVVLLAHVAGNRPLAGAGAGQLETVTVVADRVLVSAADEPFSGTVIGREEG
jgi:outer membrane receptor protein involved in Fe transport